jgi:AcrR family transcriptional regulator
MAGAAARTVRRRDLEVLEAATKVFYERGYADATVQDVADELGILKGSLYYYIETKEDLLYRLLEDAHERVEAVLAEASGRRDLVPLDRLEIYVRRHAEYHVDNLPRVAIYYQDASRLSEPRLREIQRRRRPHEAWVRAMIAEAQQRGDVGTALDPGVLANCLFGTFIWVYRWYRDLGPAGRAATIEQVTAYALAGVVGAGAQRPGDERAGRT